MKKIMSLILMAAIVIAVSGVASASIITDVVRANGQSGDRAPVGKYDGNTAPLATEEGGLKDGNICYSDRTYPWANTPADMVGSEYVRTYNSDKNGGETDVTYTVTISQAALVWITVDDRIPAEWTGGTLGPIASAQDAANRVVAAFAAPGTFKDSGLDLFVRENATTDRQMSVYWAKLAAGTYVFDSMDSGKNYYNIGAMAIEPVSDITSPGDPVLGVPNDGDWPAGEYPALAIDNRTGTKFLHRKGKAVPTGIAVTPSAGPTLVTGLSFTTANDAPNRDPIKFELSGSNVSIDGPFEVIAAGDIVDFAGATNWPRFTKNTTPIEFSNAVVYSHYKIVFPLLRGATEALMQIAEIELLGTSVRAFAPTPSNRAIGIPINVALSWSAGSKMVSQDVYFGTEEATLAMVAGGLAETSYDPGQLEYGTTYFWRVDTLKKDGSVEAGNVWSFTTTIPVGIFEYARDVGDPAGIGKTVFEGYVWKDDLLTQQYMLQGSGADIWGVNDQMQFAYNTVSGKVRVSAGFEWVARSNQWAKYGVMLRANDTGPAVNYCNVSRRDNDLAQLQWRETTGASSSSATMNRPAGATKPKRLGIQRVEAMGQTWIEAIVDWGTGKGWEPVSSPRIATANLADEILAGVVVTSHDNTHLSQVRAYDVTYELNPAMVGTFPMIPGDAAVATAPSAVSGFKIRSLKTLVTDGSFNTFAAADELLDTGMFKGLPAMPGTLGTRVDQYVNLRDTGNGVFSVANGYPDKSYPGIDPLEDPALDPAAGDDDNDFATEILGYVHLVPGVLYKVGANSDDGTYIVIGGLEVLRTAATKGNSNVDSTFFQVAVDGYYPLKARHFDRSGGGNIELHQILLNGTRLLMNDVANGAAEVVAP